MSEVVNNKAHHRYELAVDGHIAATYYKLALILAGIEIMATSSVRDNKALSRFELDVEGGLAFANYRRTPSAVIITHTETPRSLRGRGIASELVEGALQLIRADGSKVVAGCSFVVDYLHKHPEFADLAG